MPIAETVYRSAATAAWVLSPILEIGDSKLARAVRARRTAAERLAGWARRERDPARPLLWFHASSVGEGLQARAVLDAVRARRPEAQVVFTHFSPSAEAIAARMKVEYAGPLPWDAPAEIEPVVRAVRPDVVVFTKNELWPVLASAARAQGARTALVAASLHEGSSRTRWPASDLLRPTLRALDLCAAIAEEDGKRFIRAGVPSRVLRVTGDPGVDSAAARARSADRSAPYLRPFHEHRHSTLVAGSTWPADEAVLIPALASARPRAPSLRAVVAPHEPTPDAVRRLAAALARVGWRTATLGEVETRGSVGDADAVIVDRVGVLAQLYTIGDVAWVGGAFHRAGVHSVLEPAAAGLPIVFGPAHGNARAAGELRRLGAAREVGNAPDAATVLNAWFGDERARRSAGEASLGYIRSHLGASERTAERISQLVPAANAR